MVNGHREDTGCCLSETAAPVEIGLGLERGIVFARGVNRGKETRTAIPSQ